MVKTAVYGNVSLDQSTLARIDLAVRQGVAPNRAALLRTAVNDYLAKVDQAKLLEENAALRANEDRFLQELRTRVL